MDLREEKIEKESNLTVNDNDFLEDYFCTPTIPNLFVSSLPDQK